MTLRKLILNSPFFDDISRALAANVYAKLRLHDKARELLAIVQRTVNQTKAAELDPSKAMDFEGLRFSLGRYDSFGDCRRPQRGRTDL